MRLSRRLLVSLFVPLLAVSALAPTEAQAQAQAQAGRRVALVIGNSAYENTVPLPNPRNDAEALAEVLGGLGFEVLEGIDLDRASMTGLLRRYADRLKDASVGLFFYAGHGLQVDGLNYLVPVDARLEEENDLPFEAVELNLVLRLMQRQVPTSLVFMDACRNNPLAQNLSRSMGPSRAVVVGQGLARVSTGVGMLIAYATQPDAVAADGAGRHSPFTGALLKHIAAPGLEVRQVLSRVRERVVRESGGRQVPWDNSSLTSDFYFAAKPPEAKQPAAALTAVDPALLDLTFWNSVEGGRDPADFQAYLQEFPEGRFVRLARNRIRALAPDRTAAAQPQAAQPQAAQPQAAGPAAPAPAPDPQVAGTTPAGATPAGAPLGSAAEVLRHLKKNKDAIRRKFTNYNRKIGAVESPFGSIIVDIYKFEVKEIVGDTVSVFMIFAVGARQGAAGANSNRIDELVLELRWRDGAFEFVGHRRS
ncbi:MAG: caspase family protein [Proteobacteria bacterium]|nr:caspase family protein [Pseudomonadota bacterium]